MFNDDDKITIYMIDKKMIDMGCRKQTADLYKKKKYMKDNTEYYGNCVRCVLAVLAFIPP